MDKDAIIRSLNRENRELNITLNKLRKKNNQLKLKCDECKVKDRIKREIQKARELKEQDLMSKGIYPRRRTINKEGTDLINRE